MSDLRPSFTNTTKNTDQRETTCKRCPNGIFVGQPRVWSRSPLGLIHTWCAPKEADRG